MKLLAVTDLGSERTGIRAQAPGARVHVPLREAASQT